ncbi:hypothetical protein HZA40_02640 [Candidatus Peregrinibacteria bacterium]|nr:hypothetical protein [Candidatus Peregrinibacteria bacterium]
MSELEVLKQEIKHIHERNQRVELDKAWELSWTRKLIVAFLTYAVVVCFFVFAKLPDPFVNSIVPALAFIVSNLALPIFKRIWLKFKKSN